MNDIDIIALHGHDDALAALPKNRGPALVGAVDERELQGLVGGILELDVPVRLEHDLHSEKLHVEVAGSGEKIGAD